MMTIVMMVCPGLAFERGRCEQRRWRQQECFALCLLAGGTSNYSRHPHHHRQLWLLLSPRMIIRVTFILPTSFSLPEPMSTSSAVKEHPLLLCQLRWNFCGIIFKVYCFNYILSPRRVTWECCPSFSPTEQIPLSKITMAEILTGWLWEITMLPLQVVILWNKICIRDIFLAGLLEKHMKRLSDYRGELSAR